MGPAEGSRAPAPIDRHMTARKSGLTSGLPRVVQRLSGFEARTREMQSVAGRAQHRPLQGPLGRSNTSAEPLLL
jgi:hypothetical protein